MELSPHKPITEQLNLKHPLRTYLDDGSHEFSYTSLQEKINTLAKLVDKGFDLNDIVKYYNQQYSLPGYKHIRDNLALTLKEYISYLTTGNKLDWKTISALKDASEKEIIKLLKELLKEFILSEYSATRLVLSYIDYKYHNKPEEYKKISEFLNIDFDTEDAEAKYLESVCLENGYDEETLADIYFDYNESFQWDYLPLFELLKGNLLPILGEKDNETYTDFEDDFLSLSESEIRKGPKSIIYFLNKYLRDKDRLKYDYEFRYSSTLKLAINLVEVLYFDKPLFDYNVFLIKNEFLRDGLIDELFHNDQAALLVEDNFRDIEHNPETKNGEIYRKNKSRFIRLFDELNASLRYKDTLIVASYRGLNEVKIGLMSKGSQITEDPLNPKYRTLQLTKVKTLMKRKHVILDKIIRSRSMLSRIIDKSDYVTSKYYGKKPSIKYENLSLHSVKLMCMEWLRTELAPSQYRIKYLTKVSRQVMNNIDINGLTLDNKVVTAKVLFQDDREKIQKVLNQFHQSENTLNIVFSEIKIDSSIEVYNTRDIFNQLYDSKYRCFLANLVGD
ncbi:hypothetical protein [Psychroflexus montanilacus]|uniref:hypothetical protein n=1 Tax=Psychroflexus montanilacus TaxID=2873598 RepID=UPI001CCBB7C3|nr:hypothetical protein [Psychroflexus montanilacus]MBZ9652669.1 hypothetical protein [Psychroflexus montanilacus]